MGIFYSQYFLLFAAALVARVTSIFRIDNNICVFKGYFLVNSDCALAQGAPRLFRGWMSSMANEHTRAFTRLFCETARYHHRYEVFRDFVMMAGIAIQNAFLKSDELEQEYLGIVRRYEKDDAVRMSQLLAEVVMGLEAYAIVTM